MSITKDTLNSAIVNSSTALANLAEQIKNIEFPCAEEFEFETSKLSDKYVSEKLKSVPGGYAKEYKETDFIYVFELLNPNNDLKKDIYDGLRSAREIQGQEDFEGKKDFCRPNNSDSNYLYVGRSQKLKSRLKQHIDAGCDGIYAMHMLRWISGINATIKVYYFKFDSQENLVVQALEDGLWDSFQPMFGRKGDK